MGSSAGAGSAGHILGERMVDGLDPDQADAADVMGLLREELGYANKERRFPKKDTLGAIYSRTVNAGQKMSDVLKRHYPWCNDDADGIREIFRAYTVRKRTQNVMDYD